MQVVAKIINERRLMREFKHLETKGQRKVLRSACGQAATVYVREIKKEFPKEAKSLKKQIGRKVKVNKKVGVIAKVGMAVGKKKAKHVPHAHLYILGTDKRYTTDGEYRGKAPAHDVIKSGSQKAQPSARRKFIEVAREKIQKEAGKVS